MDIKKFLDEVQEAWLTACIKTYGFLLTGADFLVTLGKAHYEEIKKKDDNSSS